MVLFVMLGVKRIITDVGIELIIQEWSIFTKGKFHLNGYIYSIMVKHMNKNILIQNPNKEQTGKIY